MVVVVSAMGRAGDPYATDTLLRFAGRRPRRRSADPRDRDLLAACGEIISCVVLAHTLRSRGMPAVALTAREAGIITDDNFGNARIVRVETERVLGHLRERAGGRRGRFQGATEDGQVTTLGRGGSDTTAAVLGAALRAERMEIFKDVPGVLHRRPAAGARRGYAGAGDVPGNRGVGPFGRQSGAPPGGGNRHGGTHSDAHSGHRRRRPGTLVDDAGRVGRSMFEADRVVTGVAHVPARVRFRLPALDAAGAGDARWRCLRPWARPRVSVDMIRCIRRGHRLHRGGRGPAENRAHPGRAGMRVHGARRTGQSIRGRRGHARRAGRHGPGSAGAGRGRHGPFGDGGLATPTFRVSCRRTTCRKSCGRCTTSSRWASKTNNGRRRSMKLGSLLTAMVTPFKPDGALDPAQAARLARHLVEIGNEGVVVAGTTGESPTLTDEEKLELFRAVVGEIGGRATVVAGTGTNDTKHSIELTKEAEKLGVDAIMAVVPYYNRPPQEGLYRHFKAIAESTSLPVMLYNVPPVPRGNLLPETVARLAEIDNVVAIKEASGDMVQVAEIRRRTPRRFSDLQRRRRADAAHHGHGRRGRGQRGRAPGRAPAAGHDRGVPKGRQPHRRGHSHGAVADFQSHVRLDEPDPGEGRRQHDRAGGRSGAAAFEPAVGGRIQRDSFRFAGERFTELGGNFWQCP